MRKTKFIAALCALWMIGGTLSPGQAATVTLVRGMQAEMLDTAKTPAGGVHIARPAITAAVTPSPAAAKRTTPSRRAATFYAAGNILWRRNARTGRLSACSVGRSGMVGRDVIRCTSTRAIRR